MATIGQNFVMFSGDNAVVAVTLLGADGEPLDLNGITLFWGMGPTQGPATITKTSNSASEIAVIDGRVEIYLVPADTKVLNGQRRHELRIIDSFGAIETVLVGMITVHPSAIQPVVGRDEYATGPAGRRGRATLQATGG